MRNAAVGAVLERTRGLAWELAIPDTPAFVVGRTIVEGAVDVETLLSLYEDGDAGVGER